MILVGNILVRATAPPTLALAAFTYLYPKTSNNLFTKTWDDAAAAGLVPKEVPGSGLVKDVSESVGAGYKSAKDAVSNLFK
jgi:hypothetical protein